MAAVRPPGGVAAIVLQPGVRRGRAGLDGQLACEVRNSLWTPERLPRGNCDNGVVFGLP